MCEPATIAYGVAALAGGLYVNHQISKAQEAANAAALQPPPAEATPPAPATVKPPTQKAPTTQTSKTPAVQQLRTANATATRSTAPATPATMLTGPTGVSLQPSDIGRNTLLGS